ncbi:MAG: BamA/TamA family outer membrane protein [Reichenbachiella sp.]
MGRRYLKDDEKILVDQKLIGARDLNKEELKSLFEYKPNDRILFFPWSPYVDLYQIGLKHFDSMKYVNKIQEANIKYGEKIKKKEGKEKKQKKLREKLGTIVDKQNRNIREGNFAMRLGEPLAIYDTAKESLTLESITKYLHSKGYFNAQVSYSSDEEFKLVTSTYEIDKRDPYIVDSVFYDIQDSLIAKILDTDRLNSKIQSKVNYQQNNLVEERNRINSLMKNNGYYAFSRRFVNYVVDTASLGEKRVIVGVNVVNPTNKKGHKIYSIDSINFVTDAEIKDQPLPRAYNEYKGISYQFHSRRYSEKILDWRVFLNKDSLYSRSNTTETQKQLSNMDIFRFVNVSYDTVGGLFIANIHTSPLSKFQTSSELGLNVSQGLPGPFFNASIKNRNTFKGLEVMELSGRVGFEGISGATDTDSPYESLDYGANLSFTFPQFMFPISRDFKSRLGRLNPKTRVSFDLNFNYRPEYQRNTINASLVYSWINYKKRITHNFSLIDINFINSDVTQAYLEFLERLESEGNNLINSFNSAFVNSIWYSANYNFNDYGNKKKSSAFFRYKIETGGNTAGLYESIAAKDSIEIYQYARFNVDFRRNNPFGQYVSLAYRVKAGFALPYGDNETLPYEKFYFGGGSNSIRAWEPRRLGPGSFLPIVDSTGVYNNQYEQPGEIQFEASIELRHRLFGFVHGAIFMDIGNIWTLREDPVRPGSKFEFSNFAKELAVGAGYGLRFDLSFLLLRLDAAWKIYDPGRNYNGGYDDRPSSDLPQYEGYSNLIWNLGIGYPF